MKLIDLLVLTEVGATFLQTLQLNNRFSSIMSFILYLFHRGVGSKALSFILRRIKLFLFVRLH